MPRAKRFIPFGPYAPDRSRRDVGTLRVAENVIPVFGSYSVLPKIEVLATVAAGTNVIGGHVHYYTVAAGDQFGYPVSNGSNSDGNWVALNDEDNELYQVLQNRGIDDANRIMVAGDHGTVTARTAVIKCSNLDAPASGAGDRTLKFRYRIQDYEHTTGANWSITCSANMDVDASVTTVTTTITGTTDTDWTEATITATKTALDDQPGFDWDDIWFKVIADVPGDSTGLVTWYPESDRDNQHLWQDDSGATTGLYAAIDDTAPVDDTYVISNTIEPGEDTHAEWWFSGMSRTDDPHIHDIDGAGDSGHTLTWKWKASADDVLGHVYLFEYPKETAIAEETGISVPTTFTEDSISLSTTEAASIDDYSALYARVRFYTNADSGSAANATKHYPAVDGNPTSGSDYKPVKPWFSNVDDATDDAEYVTITGSGGSDSNFQVKWTPIADTGVYDNWTLVVRAKRAGSGTAKVQAWFTHTGTSDRVTTLSTQAVTSDWADYSVSIPAEDVESMLQGKHTPVCRVWSNDATVDMYVSAVYLSGAGAKTGSVSQVKLTVPDNARAEVSMLNLTVPTQYTYRVGDKVEVYVGTHNALFQAFDGSSWSFTDVTNTTMGGGSGTQYDDVSNNAEFGQSWDFCSWGEDLIASNFIDPTQVKDPSADDFADLATSTEKPQGRFNAVVGDFVVLGNISSLGTSAEPSGQPDEVWWSAYNNPLDWDPSPVTQCDRQRLVSTPGEITGMIGGEFGIIFKQSSIYRMNYVGSPAVFTFDVLSRTIGTDYPKSIVAVNNNVFFYGKGGFYVVANGQEVAPIGFGTIQRSIQDREFEDASVREFVYGDARERDAYVIGAFDPVSGLIYWSIRRKGASDGGDGTNDLYAHRNDYILVYNPLEDRFTYIKDTTSLRAAYIGALPDTAGGERVDRNVFAINMGTDASPTGTTAEVVSFSADNERYVARFKTNVIGASALLGEQFTGSNITIRRIRPVFWEQPESDTTRRVDITMTITCSDDPLLANNTQTDTVYVSDTVDDRDLDGWFPVKLMACEYFEVEISFTAESGDGVREILGLELDYDFHGEY